MPRFKSGDVELAYEVAGNGPPVLCIHGFASSGKVNWIDTGWVETLTGAGYQAITLDNRGHGLSDKPHDPEDYYPAQMANDALALLDHLGIERAAVLGYSMGARVAAFLTYDHPDRVVAAIFGGMGMNLINGLTDGNDIIAGLRAPNLADLTHPTARQFRIFADHTGSDREALAACMETSRQPMARADVRRIEVPVLVAVGEADEMAGSPQPLAELLPHGEAFVIPKRDHMRATGDRAFKAAALEFLGKTFPAVAV
ncbi:alpha/beta hydrolase [Devosia sp. 63-57]|uniref:alpha/beta fold hydrolase n=1 Tax=Devosia sp. 63-57 TaxID=1895751 RepID=UPI0008691A4D|nr:alpha/beta hydrolase [Devosia sp. 63-57]ODT49834.1 MAG: alpha/beta hydrolase [Pelagibacterium sp. SCN 63-126]ODU86267.1 MAG: alpha/beta hydrolase [Pelagibacterium sp. SCN 63-17]OJX45209.1 MAG: alpha/beta hydrolase [Devosia sp. 63-57]